MRSERKRRKHRQARSRKRAARRCGAPQGYGYFGPSRWSKVEFLQHALNNLIRSMWDRPNPLISYLMKNKH